MGTRDGQQAVSEKCAAPSTLRKRCMMGTPLSYGSLGLLFQDTVGAMFNQNYCLIPIERRRER